jgi:hypothetical protein
MGYKVGEDVADSFGYAQLPIPSESRCLSEVKVSATLNFRFFQKASVFRSSQKAAA